MGGKGEVSALVNYLTLGVGLGLGLDRRTETWLGMA
jgi:hypothetical protein